MLGQVIIRPVGNTPQFAPSEGEQELKVGSGLGIEAQLIQVVVSQPQVFLGQADGQQPLMAEGTPIVKPFQIGSRFAEEFHFHLLKFPDPENEIARGDLIPERFSDLPDAEGKLLSHGALYIHKVHKNALGRFGTEIHRVLGVLGYTLESFEHQVELPDVGEIMFAAGGTGNAVLFNKALHFGLCKGVYRLGQGHTLLPAPVLDQLVCTEALMALSAIHQRVRKAGKMTGGHPGLGIHQNRRIQAHIVRAFLHKFLPPGLFYIVFQFHAQGTVVPGIGQPSVNLAPGEHKTSVLAERHNFVHGFLGCFHKYTSFLN